MPRQKSGMDLDPLAVVKVEINDVDVAVKEEPLDESDSGSDASDGGDFDPLRFLQIEQDVKPPLGNTDVLDDPVTVTTNMTECNPSKYKGTGKYTYPADSTPEQYLQPDRLSKIKQEEVDIVDEYVFKREELNDIAFVAVKEECENLSENQAEDNIRTNKITEDSKTDIPSAILPQTSTSVDIDMEHLTTISTGEKNKKGDICNKNTATLTKNTCHICGYHTDIHYNLRKHMMIHTGEKPFQCKECTYKCNQASSLKRHMRIHVGDQSFRCTICTYKCKTSPDLEIHMMIHRGEKPYQCQECPHKFTRPGGLKYHMLIHRSEQPFLCMECPFKCKTSGSLKTHMRTHTGEKPFQCDQCPFRCTTSSGKKTHMMLHTGEKPFQCDQCNYKCTTSSNLRYHTMIHFGVKPFQCDQCPYKCRAPGYLSRHMMVHTDVKPFTCEVCFFKCRRTADLNRHMMNHTGEMPYECNDCTYKSRRKTLLTRHIMKVHVKL